MTTFAEAIGNQEARTLNDMKARVSTSSACVDLFYAIGASRGKNIIPAFAKAYGENSDYAMRIVLWTRDVRGGAGERELFRSVLAYLAKMGSTTDAIRLMKKIGELGRYDDFLIGMESENKAVVSAATELFASAILSKDRLANKWAPRKGKFAGLLAQYLGLKPRQYRKLIVGNTHVVETDMSANRWNDINFGAVPSQASKIYSKAFKRHTPKYGEYLAGLASGKTKVNASAIYPYQVIADVSSPELVEAQWKALPDYVGDSSVLALVDVSGSMGAQIHKSKTTCMQVAVSLGLYTADKNRGPFKDCILTFTSEPQLMKLTGTSIVNKVSQLIRAKWRMSTNLHAAFRKILNTALKNKVDVADMPKTLLILSDMQFNQCVRHDDSAIEMIRRKYEEAGYTVPSVVFWNLNDYGNVPTSSTEKGVMLVSGFSPAVMKSVLANSGDSITPLDNMLSVIMVERYNH